MIMLGFKFRGERLLKRALTVPRVLVEELTVRSDAISAEMNTSHGEKRRTKEPTKNILHDLRFS